MASSKALLSGASLQKVCGASGYMWNLSWFSLFKATLCNSFSLFLAKNT